ncbi:Nucleoside-diphosphate-sugar epimerase [Sinomicrobium oceani]|uniref:Nucleoside-diphosphate-sugar epimerase n=1 Tax=Sinomicrobium oceani TaxID=1150368 RepID=A0A1K1Q6J7_9FLAO|nr:NAD(P)H-binding protein [Sinomicrobium oceani]SFW55372.1 Nucleoside-diphosphate-sugar epimerase [Sinomicrobium oceani]
MKIVVIGATGRVGQRLVNALLNQNHTVVGTSRKAELLVDSPNFSQINLDILNSVKEIEEMIPDDTEAIYFVSGSRGKNLLQVDLHGAVKTMQAAEKLKVKRYIMLSSVFALQPNRWNESFLQPLTDYNIAKHYADQWLLSTALNYTILQPGTLEEKKGSGMIKVNVENPGGNAIENVVTTLVEVLENQAAFKKVITMHDGETPIKEAISKLEF